MARVLIQLGYGYGSSHVFIQLGIVEYYTVRARRKIRRKKQFTINQYKNSFLIDLSQI